MIFMFNEAGYPVWDITEKNENFIRIGVKSESKHPFGIDIVKKNLTMNDFFLDILDNVCTNPDGFCDVWAAADIKFAMCYNNHSGMPFLKQSTDVNKGLDLYVITFVKTDRMDLISNRSRRFNVLYTTEEPGKDEGTILVHIIATARMDNEPFFYLTYRQESIYEDETWLYHTKHVITSKAKEDVAVFIRDYHEKEVNASKYSKTILGSNQPGSTIKIAKTVIPYSVIIYPFSMENVRKDLCEKRYNKHNAYTKYINSESVLKNFMTEIKRVRSEKYSAATFYIDKPFDQVSVDDMKNIVGIDKFQRVNFLCQDGKVKSL